MWSVPKGVGYKNWFKMSIIAAKTPTDVALLDDMHYDKRKLTPGDCAPAGKGSDAWTVRGYRVEGVMATNGEATSNTLIERV